MKQQAQAGLARLRETQDQKASPEGVAIDAAGDDGIKITHQIKQIRSNRTTVVVDDDLPSEALIPQAEASSVGLESLISTNRIALHSYYATSKALMQGATAAQRSLDEN